MRIALAKDPAERFQTGRELVEAVALVADIAPPARLETVERQTATAVIKDAVPAERSEAGVSSSPSLTQSSNIDDIFKELTFYARITDLSRQQTGKPFNWWLLAAGATLFALVAAAVFFLTRS
jgi:hypothetical protein